MKTGKRAAIGIAALLSITACEKEKPHPDWATLRPVVTEDEIATLRKRISLLESNNEMLVGLAVSNIYFDGSLNKLENRVSWVEAVKADNVNRTVRLNFAMHSYVLIETLPLPLLIIPMDAVPYLDGYRLTLNICNPHSIQFDGFEAVINTHSIAMQLSTNKSGVTTVKNVDAYNAGARTTRVQSTEILHSGIWNTITLDVSPLTAQEFRTMDLGLELNDVQGLNRRDNR